MKKKDLQVKLFFGNSIQLESLNTKEKERERTGKNEGQYKEILKENENWYFRFFGKFLFFLVLVYFIYSNYIMIKRKPRFKTKRFKFWSDYLYRNKDIKYHVRLYGLLIYILVDFLFYFLWLIFLLNFLFFFLTNQEINKIFILEFYMIVDHIWPITTVISSNTIGFDTMIAAIWNRKEHW